MLYLKSFFLVFIMSNELLSQVSSISSILSPILSSFFLKASPICPLLDCFCWFLLYSSTFVLGTFFYPGHTPLAVGLLNNNSCVIEPPDLQGENLISVGLPWTHHHPSASTQDPLPHLILYIKNNKLFYSFLNIQCFALSLLGTLLSTLSILEVLGTLKSPLWSTVAFPSRGRKYLLWGRHLSLAIWKIFSFA